MEEERLPRLGRREIARAAAFPIALLGLFVLAQTTGLLDAAHDRKAIHAWLESHPDLAPALYVALSTFLPLILIPRSFLMLSGGLIFGWMGVVYSLTAVFLGDCIAFWTARWLARPLFERLIRGTRARRALARVRREGFWAVLLMAMTPVMPTYLINYGSGLAGIRYRSFAPGSVLGILPLCLLYTHYGNSLDESTLDFFYSIPLFAVPLLILLLLMRWRYNRMEADEPEPDRPAGRSDADAADPLADADSSPEWV